MSWLLNVVYVGFLVAASPWLAWRYFSAGKNRRGWSHKLFGLVEPRKSDQPRIWMHAVSVGEVNLLAPILAQLEIQQPGFEVVISTTTETGFDLAQKRFPQHYVFFCPMDLSWAIRRALKRIRPCMLVLAELELWPNLIRTARSAGVPVAVVNGRLSENSFRGYKKFRWLVGGTFNRLSVVAAQNETYAQRFRELGCDTSNVHVTGNVKFDGVESNRENAHTQRLIQLVGIGANDRVFVAGSTQLEEDLMAARVYQQLSTTSANHRLILVPRHPERCGSLAQQLNQLGVPSILRSSLNGDRSSESWQSLSAAMPNMSVRPVLIVDVIGELGAWWGCADAAYVGGSMGARGGQNMIEPAAYGLPVSFGPNTANFRQIVEELLAHNAATVVSDEASMLAFVEHAFGDPDWAAKIGDQAMNVVMNHVGASQRTVEVLSAEIRPLQDFEIPSGDQSTRAA